MPRVALKLIFYGLIHSQSLVKCAGHPRNVPKGTWIRATQSLKVTRSGVDVDLTRLIIRPKSDAADDRVGGGVCARNGGSVACSGCSNKGSILSDIEPSHGHGNWLAIGRSGGSCDCKTLHSASQ